MALDGIFLRHLANELKNELKGARVDKISQPNKDELVFTLRTYSGSRKLLISARANSARVHITKYAPENPQSPPMLCMLLRKRLSNARLADIRQPGLERMLFFDFDATNELGDPESLTLAVEIMGKHSNVILIDSGGAVIDSLKRVDMTMSSLRLVLPGVSYGMPPVQNKLSILDSSSKELSDKITHSERDVYLSRQILDCLQGVSPIVCRELEFLACRSSEVNVNSMSDEQRQRLEFFINRLMSVSESVSGEPHTVYEQSGKPMDFCFMNITQYGAGAVVSRKQDFSGLLDEFYLERDKADRMRVKAQDLLRLLSNATDRAAKKINAQSAELERSTDREYLRQCGDLLQANIYRVEKGVQYVEVENFFNEMQPMKIKLNPAISPSQNVQRYYRDYKKAKNAEQFLTLQIEKSKSELIYLESVFESLARAETERELGEIRAELTDVGYVRKSVAKTKNTAPLPPLEFITSDGLKVLVGRNNRQNDKLTLKTAAKNDLWFHTKGIPGAHTVLVTDGTQPPDKSVTEAASIAAFHSKAKNGANVPVDYVRVKNVNKPQGAKPGMVIYSGHNTVYVDPVVPNTVNAE